MVLTFTSQRSLATVGVFGSVFTLLLGALLLCFGSAVAVGAQAAEIDSLWARAEAAFLDKRVFADGEHAVALYEQLVLASPDHVDALIRLAELHYWLGEMTDGDALSILERGIEFAKRAVAVADDHPEAHYWVGVLTGRIGEERGILQSLFMVKDIMLAVDRALELDPYHAGAHLLASQVYRKAPGWPLSIGDKKKAVEHGLEAVRLNPDKTIHVLNLAEAYLNDRQRDKAREMLQQVIDMPLTPGDEVVSQQEKDRAAELLAGLK